ncbi:Nardilysin [Pseudolycoriella hygida]|uniref:Nardilysin n=1 Tax=Pseudolycoriella hygida TaxID=35572 RepID=A0A9Q0MRM1_9DIPT|nr:Nardilysin [Pseudolycoriella hygida]
MFKVMETPDKPDKDRKDYRIIKLENGLTALIISDPSPIIEGTSTSCANIDENIIEETDGEEDESGSEGEEEEEESSEGGPKEKLAACSLCIDVGSFSDPRDIQGLAHFLEHMIFMGSKKYPKENEFEQYIKRSSGFDNGVTDCEETLFYFEVSENSLNGAIDRFANLFKEPLMLKECMTREREAVESEFQSKGHKNEVRREQLLSSLGNVKHPTSIFTWGNLKTLQENVTDDELHHRVHEFRKRHYSAHRMYACIQARLPLDDIQAMVIEHFSDIPNNGMPGDDFSEWNHLNAFQDQFTQKIFVVKSVGNVTKLDVTFCLESLVREYKTKAHDYVAFLLAHEGKGSLASYLRKKNWILTLMAGVDDSGFDANSLYSLFTITISLTQTGMNHVKEILEAVFGFIKFISILDPRTTETLYTELQTIHANNFRFRSEQTALENVETLVVNLKYCPPKDAVTGPNLLFEYNYDLISAFVDKLNSTKGNIMITTKTPFEGREFDQKEQWFGTQYCSFDIPEDWLEKLQNPTIPDDFHLPRSNVYIPKDLTVLYNPETMKVGKYPDKIMENEICELWYRLDDKFLLPTACYNFYFKSTMCRESIENVIMMSLYSMLLEYKIVEILYPATEAGLSYSSYNSEKGLILRVDGFSQNIYHLVDTYVKNLTTFAGEVTEEEFNMFVEQLLKIYYNTLTNPKSFAKYLRLSIIENDFHPTLEKYEALKKLTLQGFQKFAAKFLKKLRIEALCQGNLSSETTRSIMENVLSHLNAERIEELTMLDLRAHKLPIGVNYLRCASMNIFDTNTVTCNYYQIGPITIKTNVLLELLMMVSEEPLFDSLRSKEQLGYDVSCSLRDNHGILGYTIVVNSQENKFSAEYIDERIEAFRVALLSIIRETCDEEFEQYKESVLKIKLSDDNNLSDEVSRNWTEITTNEYAYDRICKEVECLKNVTKSEFLEFYEKHLLESTKKFSVQVIGRTDVNPDIQPDEDTPVSLLNNKFELTFIPMLDSGRGSFIENIPLFLKTLELYPVSKTIFNS